MNLLLGTLINEEMLYAALKSVIDPELGINIVDLGLIVGIEIGEDGHITIDMTLTTPGCPLHAAFAQEIEGLLWQVVPGLSGVTLNLVWEPPWTPAMISAEGRTLLGID